MSEHEELNRLLQKTESTVGKRSHCNQNDTVVSSFDWVDDIDSEPIGLNNMQWTSNDGKMFVPAGVTRKTLDPGVYEIKHNHNIGLFFEKIPVRAEGLLNFPDSNSDRVITEIKKFWEREEAYRIQELIHKRGIILYGPPGSGKSCTIQLIMQDVVKREGVVIRFCTPELFISGIRELRGIQPKTPIVVIMEDLDSILERYNESEVLNILDGVNKVEKVVFLATTNYPELLGARIVNRPSRFDKRFRIGYPNEDARRMYFSHLFSKDKSLKVDIERWVKDTPSMSIAHLRELFIAVNVLGDEYEEALNTLRSMKERVDDKEYDMIGFGAKKD